MLVIISYFCFNVNFIFNFNGVLVFPSCAVSEAGLIILPSPHGVGGEEAIENVDMLEKDSVTLKWPRRPGLSDVNLFDSEDSWYDPPPEGFSLTVSLVKISTKIQCCLHFQEILSIIRLIMLS